MMRLSADQLKRQIHPQQFHAQTEQLADGEILGQARASAALHFGLAIQKPGYNLYLAGDSGTGRSHYIKEYLQATAVHGKAPSDWICVNNFDKPSEPRIFALQQGMGERVQQHIEQFIQELVASFPDAFENPSYIQQRTALQNAFNQKYDQALLEVERIAAEKNIAVYREDGAISFGILVDGQIAEDAYFSQMNEQEREQFQNHVRELEQLLNESLMELPKWQRDVNDKWRDNWVSLDQIKEDNDALVKRVYGYNKPRKPPQFKTNEIFSIQDAVYQMTDIIVFNPKFSERGYWNYFKKTVVVAPLLVRASKEVTITSKSMLTRYIALNRFYLSDRIGGVIDLYESDTQIPPNDKHPYNDALRKKYHRLNCDMYDNYREYNIGYNDSCELISDFNRTKTIYHLDAGKYFSHDSLLSPRELDRDRLTEYFCMNYGLTVTIGDIEKEYLTLEEESPVSGKKIKMAFAHLNFLLDQMHMKDFRPLWT